MLFNDRAYISDIEAHSIWRVEQWVEALPNFQKMSVDSANSEQAGRRHLSRLVSQVRKHHICPFGTTDD